jgi:hypothetical protein
MEAVDNLAEMSSRDTHQAKAKMSVKPPMGGACNDGDRWLQKHIEGAVTAEQPWCSRGAALRREQLGKSS